MIVRVIKNDLLQQMGADIKIDDKLVISGGKSLRGIKIDANEIPDLVPTLAVVATRAEGCTEFMSRRDKETDNSFHVYGLARWRVRRRKRRWFDYKKKRIARRGSKWIWRPPHCNGIGSRGTIG